MKANVASDPVVPVLSPPLRDVPPSASMMDPFTEDDDRHLPTKQNRAVSAPTGPDGALQLSPGPSLLSPTGVNFDGLPANGFAKLRK